MAPLDLLTASAILVGRIDSSCVARSLKERDFLRLSGDFNGGRTDRMTVLSLIIVVVDGNAVWLRIDGCAPVTSLTNYQTIIMKIIITTTKNNQNEIE